MANKIHRLAPTGNMDKDTDLRYVGKGDRAGDYTDARNIQRVSPEGGVQGSVIPTLGNEFAYDLGSVTQQNKRYRIFLDGDASKQHAVRFLSTQRDANILVGTGPFPGQAVEFNGTVASCVAALQAAGNAGVMSFSSTATTVDITMTAYPMYQWYAESVGQDVVQVTCVAEAIPVDLAGPLKDIGSYDLLGDLFIFSTTQDNEPTEIAPQIILVGPTSGGTYIGPLTRLLFNGNHGLVQGQWIRITGSNEPFLNGLFVVNSVVDATQIEIVTVTAWGVSPAISPNGIGTPQVIIHPTGIGEIGVAQKDDNTDTWTYTRLLRSVELNFVSRWAIKIDSRTKNDRKIVYFTDNYNDVRFISYGGGYVQDGLLAFANSENSLLYDSISFQTSLLERLFERPVSFEFLSQLDTGGVLVAGNKYYAYRFLDQFDNPTKWSDITGAVPVYARAPSIHDPITIKGNEPGFVTSKANVLVLSNIPQEIFRSVEFAVIEPVADGSASATVFTRMLIPQNAQSITVTHTGLEDEQVPLDVGELVTSATGIGIIRKAKALSIIDKRLVLGNLTYSSVSDFRDFSKTFLHTLSYKVEQGTGDIVGPSGTSKQFGGSISPQIVESSPTLVLNETYRVGVDYELTDGTVTSTFHVDDIVINTSVTNTANPTDNRRISGLPDYILNESTFPYNQKIPQIVFSGIDPDYLIEGIPVKQVVRKIRFRFAKVIKEVLASGYVVMGVSGNNQFSPVGPATIGMNQQTDQGSGPGVMPYPNFLDRWRINGTNVNPMLNELTPTSGAQYPMTFTPERSVCAFFSPEVSMGDFDTFEVTAADKLNVFYPIRPVSRTPVQDNFIAPRINTIGGNVSNGGAGSRGYPSARAQYIIHPEPTVSGLETDNSVLVRTIGLDEAEVVGPGEEKVVAGTNFHNFLVENSIGSWSIPFNQTGSSRYKLSNAKCLAVKTVSDIYPADANPLSGASNYWDSEGVDKGIYYAQIFRETPNKYGNPDNTQYDSSSSQFDMDQVEDLLSQLPVSGGDAFITTVYLRHRFNDNNTPGTLTPGSWSNITTVHETGRHLGIFYTCQSYRNMDLVYVNPASDSFPEDYAGTYVERMYRWTEDLQGEYLQYYNESYSRFLSVIPFSAYFDDDRIKLNLPARIAWSQRDIYSSVDDAMLSFLPLDIFDLDTTWGAIYELSNVNGELFSLQPRKWQRQYFNARGTLESSNNSVNVLLGAGDVLSRDGETLSSYGTEHQWSVVKGRSQGGKDVLYWFNAENGLFMRFGADGTVILSDQRRMRAFSNKAAKWVRGKDTPAFDQGIRAVWDDRNKEAIWTFTGWRDVPQWARPGIIIPSTVEGAVVTNSNAPSVTYENLPRMFRAKSTNANLLSREPGVGADWQEFYDEIPVTDTDYYSVFTLAHNELTNGFSAFYGHIPKTYLKWRDTFLSSHPVLRNLLFEHRKGQYTTWYGKQGVEPKIEDAHIEMVLNEMPEQTMRGVAVRYLSDNVPDRVDYTTRRQRTHDTAATLTQIDDYYTGPIRNDETVTGDPDSDGQPLSGDYLRIKFTIFGGTYNLLHSMVVKIFDRLRRVNR